jgi:prepilin-type N-terminal cleavage/methylation domain-containing protein
VDRNFSSASCSGLTLVELMIALVILCVTVVAVSPSVGQVVHSARVRAEAARLVSAINLARSESILRNQPVSLCPSAVAVTGDTLCASSYGRGWMVFSNPNRDTAFDAEEDELIRIFPGIPQGYRLTNRTGTRDADEVITYLPDGSARRNVTFKFCPPERGLEPWSVVLNRVGRARLSRGDGRCSA